MLDRIIKVQQLSWFTYRLYDVLPHDFKIPTTEYNYQHRNYVEDCDPNNLDLWLKLGFNPAIEYIPMTFKTDSTIDYFDFLKMGGPLESNVVLPTNCDFNQLSYDHDYSECYISRPDLGEMYQNFSIVEKKYLYRSIINTIKVVGGSHSVLFPILAHNFLKYINTFDKNKVYQDVTNIDLYVKEFIIQIKLYDKSPDVALAFETYTPFIMALASLDNKCFQEMYYNLYPLYRTALENWYNEFTHERILEDLRGPRHCILGKSHDDMDKIRQNLVYQSDVIKSTLKPLTIVCQKFIENEKLLYKRLRISHHTEIRKNHIL